MALPKLNLTFSNGNIGTVVPLEDGIFGVIASAVAVVDKFELNTVYTLKGMQDVAARGIVPSADNYVLYKWLSEYFAEAGEGSEIWLLGLARDTKVSDWFTPDVVTGKEPASKLMDAANGRLTGLFTAFSPDGDYTPTVEDARDADVAIARAKAQTFAEKYTGLYYTPIFVVLELYGFTGDAVAVPTLLEGSDNRTQIFVGDTKMATTVPATKGTSSGEYAGRLARIPLNQNPGRVRTGSVATTTAYIVDTAVESFDVEALHDKGYVTYRTHVRKSGYYFTDGPMATEPEDDYSQINRRRVIDKAFRIAHNTAVEELLEDFDLNNDGTVSAIYAKGVEANIERAIFNEMTASGELSRDQSNKDDLGVKALMDLTVNVAQTNSLKMKLSVRPRGTNRFFDITLGYQLNLNN